MVSMSQNKHLWSINRASMERQRRANDFGSCIMEYVTAMDRRLPTINVSAAYISINSSDYIPSASYNWVPTER